MSLGLFSQRLLLLGLYAIMVVAVAGGVAYYLGGGFGGWIAGIVLALIVGFGQAHAMESLRINRARRQWAMVAGWVLVALALLAATTIFSYNFCGRLLDRGEVVQDAGAGPASNDAELVQRTAAIAAGQAVLRQLVETVEAKRIAERATGGVCENAPAGAGVVVAILGDRGETYSSIAGYLDQTASAYARQAQLAGGAPSDRALATARLFNQTFAGQFDRESTLLAQDAQRFSGAESFPVPGDKPFRCTNRELAAVARQASMTLRAFRPIPINADTGERAEAGAADSRILRLMATMGVIKTGKAGSMTFNDVFALVAAVFFQVFILMLTLAGASRRRVEPAAPAGQRAEAAAQPAPVIEGPRPTDALPAPTGEQE